MDAGRGSACVHAISPAFFLNLGRFARRSVNKFVTHNHPPPHASDQHTRENPAPRGPGSFSRGSEPVVLLRLIQ